MITFDSHNIYACTESIEGKHTRSVTVPITVYLFGMYLLTIPVGFVSDGMSFPWFTKLKWKDPWHPKYAFAAVLHDYLLKVKTHRKAIIDWMFLGALINAHVPALECFIFYNSVRTRNPGKY